MKSRRNSGTAVALHGGAGMKKTADKDAVRKKMLEISHASLAYGAVDAAAYAVKRMEEGGFNAGADAVAASDGMSYRDAGIMDSMGNCGAVARYGGIHPIDAAKKLMKRRHCLEAHDGGGTGILGGGSDTVGAVAIDRTGMMAAAVSTGGMERKHPRRIGDAAVCGAGFYAHERGAAVATGDGDKIIKTAMCARICHAWDMPAMIKRVLYEVKKDGGYAGVIAVDGTGGFHRGMAAAHMAYVTNRAGIARFTI